LLQAGKEVGLETYAEKTKDIIISHHQNVRQNQNKIFKKCDKVQIFWNDSNVSKLHSKRC